MVKRGCRWVKVSHEKVDANEVIQLVRTETDSNNDEDGCLVLKFEPFILHAQCRTLELAKSLHTIRFYRLNATLE